MIQKIWGYRSIILVVICIILAILFLKECEGRKNDAYKNKQNETALTEGMKVVKLKNGQLISEKAILVGKVDDIGKLNKDLGDVIEELKKNGIKPQFITITKFQYIDTGKVANKLNHVKDDVYSSDFSYIDDDSILQIKGRSRFFAKSFIKEKTDDGKYVLGIDFKSDTTIFDLISFKTGFVLGIKTDSDGIDRVFAKPHPYTDKIKIDNIDAAFVEDYYKKKYDNKQKNKRFSLSPYVGYGLSVGSGGVVHMGPQFGIGLGYSLIRF